MSRQAETIRQPLMNTDYESVRATRKINLLLQRSVRYSYRQRCCGCCPTILCELLFPFLIIAIVLLGRYGINQLANQLADSGDRFGPLNQRACSQLFNDTPTSSNELMKKCFKFPPRYKDNIFGDNPDKGVSNATNIVFEPNRVDINDIVERAKERLNSMNCINATVW